MYLFKKNQIMKAKIQDYLEIAGQTLDVYQEAMAHYLENGGDEHFHTLVKKTHERESKADDLRREIELDLFGKSLLPEMREDIIQVIDLMDKIPNRCERTVRQIYTHNLSLPKELNPKLAELVRLGVECCRSLGEAVMDVLGSCSRIKEISQEVDTNESVADGIEEDLMYAIFHGDYEPHEQILYRDAVQWMARLPDLAETICDQLMIIAIKRNV